MVTLVDDQDIPRATVEDLLPICATHGFVNARDNKRIFKFRVAIGSGPLPK
jgi:hypothetical protein